MDAKLLGAAVLEGINLAIRLLEGYRMILRSVSQVDRRVFLRSLDLMFSLMNL